MVQDPEENQQEESPQGKDQAGDAVEVVTVPSWISAPQPDGRPCGGTIQGPPYWVERVAELEAALDRIERHDDWDGVWAVRLIARTVLASKGEDAK